MWLSKFIELSALSKTYIETESKLQRSFWFPIYQKRGFCHPYSSRHLTLCSEWYYVYVLNCFLATKHRCVGGTRQVTIFMRSDTEWITYLDTETGKYDNLENWKYESLDQCNFKHTYLVDIILLYFYCWKTLLIFAFIVNSTNVLIVWVNTKS